MSTDDNHPETSDQTTRLKTMAKRLKAWQTLLAAVIGGLATLVAAIVALHDGKGSEQVIPVVLASPTPSVLVTVIPDPGTVTLFGAPRAYLGPDCEECVTGILFAGRYPVQCKYQGRLHKGPEGHNHWWLLIEREDLSDIWVSAYHLKYHGDNEAKYDDGSEIPLCTF
ncbi:hypothetical protein Misp01_41370 [Microtetraspora sp. NBRC 13810]|uniref:hypothetical protein n=1 Tax=Microtetraspora sp. NBRC 13810 TaxID=3030990 RepID=UPI0025562E0B|nr:hypothetical protein [Microtetraspora sp. NBRC 13810]GLW09007.1 hypothetical protein Misp01_41370 [Microtetraspora sp. NBRC 13810]